MFQIMRYPHQNYILNSKIGKTKKQLGFSDEDIYAELKYRRFQKCMKQ